MTFSCPKCKHNVMRLTNVKEITFREWIDADDMADTYDYEGGDWLGTCDLCGYGFEAKTLTELIENLETVGAVK